MNKNVIKVSNNLKIFTMTFFVVFRDFFIIYLLHIVNNTFSEIA